MTKAAPQILLTFISIDKKQKARLYIQLYEQIKQSIYQGLLCRGERLPSTREMAKELGVSRNTVLQVFEQLEMEGFITGRTGAGTFISDYTDRLTGNIKCAPKPEKKNSGVSPMPELPAVFADQNGDPDIVLPFQLSVPATREFPFAILSRVSADVYKKAASLPLGYDDIQGYLPLREALADHLRISRSIRCVADQVLIVNSSRQALHLAAELLIRPGDDCWMEDPGYQGALSAFQRFGGNICPVPVTADGIDVDFAMKHYPQARLAYITPSHQFPMGSTLSLSARLKLLNWAKEHQMWIIEDDYDSEFRYNSRPIPALQSMGEQGNVIYLGTVSKVLLPAFRLGYMIFPSKELARKFTAAKAVIDGQSNVFNQAIIGTLIREGYFSRHIRRMKLLYKKAQDDLVLLIRQHLSMFLIPVPVEAGMHLIALLADGYDAECIAEAAGRQQIIVHTIRQYSIRPNAPNGLVMGFSAWTFEEMESTVLKLKKIFGENPVG